ncbi:chorismate mutase [bacterium]|nr:chorismate mutase [bacterium]
MYQRGIRGAITVESNTKEAVKSAVIELLEEIKQANNLDETKIAHVLFTHTKDINCIYPAKIAREEFSSWKYVPMMCVNEMEIEQSLKMCLRVLIVINTELEQNEIKHVYLKGAAKLREDLK